MWITNLRQRLANAVNQTSHQSTLTGGFLQSVTQIPDSFAHQVRCFIDGGVNFGCLQKTWFE